MRYRIEMAKLCPGGQEMYTYCVFCETVRCDYVARTAEQTLHCKSVSPKQVQHTWFQGKMVDVLHDLFPGYVFMYTDEPMDILRIQKIHGVIRCLSSSEGMYELTGADRQFALMLFQHQGIIGKTKVYEEGQFIRICQGAFEGVETRILKVNRHKQRMLIEIPFANMPVKTWVEFEIVTEMPGA